MEHVITAGEPQQEVAKREKIVYVKRKQTFIENANKDPEVQAYFNMSYQAVGSYYKETGKQYGTGLTSQEIRFLLPEYLGIFPEDKKEFFLAVRDFYRNKNTKIPPEGLRLNVALERQSEPLSETNLPLVLSDYITYMHIVGHPEVSASLEKAEMYQHKRFYIEDTENVISNATIVSEKEDQTRLEYYKIIEDKDKVEQMLILLGFDTKGRKDEERKLALKSFATIEEKRTSTYNESKLDRFMKVSNDRRLEAKYTIEQMIKYDIMERVGTSILLIENGEEIGADMTHASLWLTNKENIRTVNALRARLREFKK